MGAFFKILSFSIQEKKTDVNESQNESVWEV